MDENEERYFVRRQEFLFQILSVQKHLISEINNNTCMACMCVDDFLAVAEK